ncbi:flagellar biosynthesis protein FlhF [Ferviditalea candida]|uniref:Flagellar biosynthesis protein FlhF n=1 Tax=Ferviditalea candida TaxID=3108399 RepID=A0ABU5ZHJ7_9BACL|nr:flagellar biosynthesis protein FlhF [Paenibacillaceae bacterium T2]
MRVKRYVVDNMPEALQKIRGDLGKDAVILNTKETRSGGIFGLFGKKKIEVIAATDTPTVQPRVSGSLGSHGASGSYGSSGSLTAREEQAAAFIAAGVQNSQLSGAPLQETRGTSQAQAQAAVKVNQANQRGSDDLILAEIKQMKDLFQTWSQTVNANSALPPVLQKIERRLLEQDVEPVLVKSLILKAVEEAGDQTAQLSSEQAVGLVKKQLIGMLQRGGSKRISKETRIAHFVGPTGVGKTTTIAKLAAEQVLKHNRKVGFITSDTYRIAAVEQLRTYATILNVPLEVVFSPLELPKAFQKFSDRDLIFMDTAGRNYRNEMYVSELNSLLQSDGNAETYLVLSMTSKYRDMNLITENFSKFKLDKLLFTKMDETDSYGSVINLMHDFSLQLSYVTNGQNVPDDIVELNEEHLVDTILEGILDE